MMTKKIVLTTICASLFIAVAVFAQDASVDSNIDSAQVKIKQEIRVNTPAQLRVERREILQDINDAQVQLRNEIKAGLQNFGTSTPQEKERVRQEIQEQREEVRQNVLALRENLRERAEELRQNFREKITEVRTRARIAAAYGKGLRMLNRFRAAIHRFDHILTRLETRTDKMEERGIDVSSVRPMIEEAKVMLTEAETKFEELKAKYVDLLEGDDPKDIAGEGKEIARELKGEIVKLHDKLREIVHALADLTPENEVLDNTSSVPETNNE